ATMKPEEISPPAIVRAHVDVAQLDAAIRAQYTGLRRDRRRTLEQAVALGRLLQERRVLCKVAEWTPYLERQGTSTHSASDYARIAELPAELLATADSITDALRLWHKRRQDGEVTPPGGVQDNEGRNSETATPPVAGAETTREEPPEDERGDAW